MPSNVEKVKKQFIEDPELLIQLALVVTRARVKAKVNLTQDEKAEVFDALADAIRTQAITGI